MYYNAIMAHDTELGDFVQVSPAVNIMGTVKVDDFVMIGANATILPKLTVGKHAMIGAAAVVTKSVPPHALVVGNPARRVAWVSDYGDKLTFDDEGRATCGRNGTEYQLVNDAIVKREGL